MSPVNLDRVQSWVDQGRLDPLKPITVKELVQSRCIHGVKDGVKLLARVRRYVSVIALLTASLSQRFFTKITEGRWRIANSSPTPRLSSFSRCHFCCRGSRRFHHHTVLYAVLYPKNPQWPIRCPGLNTSSLFTPVRQPFKTIHVSSP